MGAQTGTLDLFAAGHAEAAVSIGQIYRLFTGKDDIILAIVEENVRVRVAGMYSIFDAVERGDLAMFDAIKAIAGSSLDNTDSSLFYAILAEACRNPLVAERFEAQTAFYREGIRRLAAPAARKGVGWGKRVWYVEIL